MSIVSQQSPFKYSGKSLETFEQEVKQTNLLFYLFVVGWRLNLGPCACRTNTVPLSYLNPIHNFKWPP